MPSEIGTEDMVSKQDDESAGESQAETEFTSLDNTSQGEGNNCSEDVENEDTITRNDNYAYHNAADTRNLDNALLSMNREAVITENGHSNCESGTNVIRIMENDAENNVTEPVRCEAETQSYSSNEVDVSSTVVSSTGTTDNTTQTSLQDTQPDDVLQPKNETSKKNFNRCLESTINNSDNSQSNSRGSLLYSSNRSNDNETRSEENCDSIDGAASLPLQIPVIDSSSGEGSSTCDNDVVLVNRNKPFKLPSLVNLYEAAEAQRAELEDQDVLTAMSSMDIDSAMFIGAESSTSDPESQQAFDLRRNKKVEIKFIT